MNKSRLISIMVIAILGLSIFSACGLLGGSDADLLGSKWELVSINGVRPLAGSSISLNFDKDSLGGNGGCNSYGGDYKVKGDKLSVSSVFSTEMYCMTEGVMDQEATYLQLLSQVEKISIGGEELILTTSDGSTLIFAKNNQLPD